MRASLLSAALALCHVPLSSALQLDLTSASSISNDAKIVAANMWTYYNGWQLGGTPGFLPPPYYWWQCGGMMEMLITYWKYTSDDQYNWAIRQAIVHQSGSDGIFMPLNESLQLGNDDQVFWGYVPMTAAEYNFEGPQQNDSVPGYVAMAQSVANDIQARWDTSYCNGGLRWQSNPLNNGWTYKNTVANGGLFLLAARLARYTGNNSYVELAERQWNWISNSTLYNPATFQVNDGAYVDNNCTKPTTAQFSYNYSILFAGMAFLYDYTKDEKWLTPLKGILSKFFATFAPKQILEELCEPSGQCNTDQEIFKAFDMRWLVLTMQLVPETADQIKPYITASANGAAAQCDGPGNVCGYHWGSTTYDGSAVMGNEMSALSAIQSGMYLVNPNLPAPLSRATGGDSVPTNNPGGGNGQDTNTFVLGPITTGDRAGAGILTALGLALTLGGSYWLCFSPS